MKCDTATIIVHHNVYGVVKLTVPAYTRTMESFYQTILDHLSTYLTLSDYGNEGMSTADFALYLLLSAQNNEPREQEEDG